MMEAPERRLTVIFCWSRYLLKYDNAAYVIRQPSSRRKNFCSSGDLSHVSLSFDESLRNKIHSRNVPEIATPRALFRFNGGHDKRAQSPKKPECRCRRLLKYLKDVDWLGKGAIESIFVSDFQCQ